MEPPIQTEYFLSGGATILIFMEEGARAVISFCIRSAIPGYIVVPPDYCRMINILFIIPLFSSIYHNDVGIQVLTDINITLHDRIISGFVNTSRFKTQERRLEKSFRSTETKNRNK
jgi:hypothetical protein